MVPKWFSLWLLLLMNGLKLLNSVQGSTNDKTINSVEFSKAFCKGSEVLCPLLPGAKFNQKQCYSPTLEDYIHSHGIPITSHLLYQCINRMDVIEESRADFLKIQIRNHKKRRSISDKVIANSSRLDFKWCKLKFSLIYKRF